MEGRKKMEEVYRKLKVGMKLKYAFTTVIVTFAVAMVVSLVSIVMMNVDTYKFYKQAYANSTLQMETSVSMLAMRVPRSMCPMKDEEMPTFSASCSCVRCFALRASRTRSPKS